MENPTIPLQEATELLRRSAQEFKTKFGNYMYVTITLEETGPKIRTNLPFQSLPTVLMMAMIAVQSGDGKDIETVN